MLFRASLQAFAFAAIASASTSAMADFSGQTILGPLVPGSSVNGNTIGHADDNDGFSSGIHIFDIWPGPDDVWQLNWPGGDLHATMTYDSPADDLDLFLYEPGSYDDSGNYSILSNGLETIDAPGAVAGTYYLVVDSDTADHAGPYILNIAALPEPGTLCVVGAMALLPLRRRR